MIGRFEFSGVCCSEAYDAYGDCIDRSTDMSIPASVPIFWEHRRDHQIGVGKITRDQRGLFIKGNFSLDEDDPTEALALKWLSGTPHSLSIGYFFNSNEGPRPRRLRECEIREVSICRQAADPAATLNLRRIL